jgi:hypothetical protein
MLPPITHAVSNSTGTSSGGSAWTSFSKRETADAWLAALWGWLGSSGSLPLFLAAVFAMFAGLWYGLQLWDERELARQLAEADAVNKAGEPA